MLLIYGFLVQSTLAEDIPPTSTPVEVDTRLGRVRGTETVFLNQKVRSYLSVPFAEPPIGENRFRPPKPKTLWKEPIEANTPSPACYQGRDNYNTSFWGSEMWNANTQISEDCLYMNIWAPADAFNLTVMVWLFGGGYYSGSPSLILYDGKALAVTGQVIVVNINYRVGPFGYLFMDHEDAPGNMGMLDQQMALYWIKDNIFNFGGNPDRITLFGESAGAASIVAHLIAPGSHRLFKHGILQSGSLDNKWSLDTPTRAKKKGEKLAELVGCNRTQISDTISCLRNSTAQKLVDEIWNVGLQFLEFPFVIVSRDKNFFKHKDGFIALRNKDYAKGINLMIGINHDEGNFWNIYNLAEFFDKPVQPELTREEFYTCVDRAFAAQPEIVRSAAKFVYSDPQCEKKEGKRKFYAEQVNQMVGDYFFTCDSIWLADQIVDDSSNSAQVFVYYFDQPSSANPWPEWTGVMHGYEIEYVFGVPLYNKSAGYTRREELFSKKVIDYWTSFASTGVPRLPELKNQAAWPKIDGKTNLWMNLKSGSHLGTTYSKKKVECDLWRHSRDMEYRGYVQSVTSSSYTSSHYLMAATTSTIYLFARLVL